MAEGARAVALGRPEEGQWPEVPLREGQVTVLALGAGRGSRQCPRLLPSGGGRVGEEKEGEGRRKEEMGGGKVRETGRERRRKGKEGDGGREGGRWGTRRKEMRDKKEEDGRRERGREGGRREQERMDMKEGKDLAEGRAKSRFMQFLFPTIITEALKNRHISICTLVTCNHHANKGKEYISKTTQKSNPHKELT